MVGCGRRSHPSAVQFATPSMSKPPTPPHYVPPPPSAARPKGQPGNELGDRVWRREMLELEADAETERSREAILRWGVAHLWESSGDPAKAVRSYLAAYNLAPGYLPPLRALIRLFERRRSLNNLSRLYDASVRSAYDHADRASALLDRAVHVESHEQDPETALTFYEQAAAHAPESAQVAAALERSAHRARNPSLARTALELRAHTARDPVLRALFLHELAEAKDIAQDTPGALAALEEALALPAAKWRTYQTMERIGRRRGDAEVLARALEGMAQLALDAHQDPTAGSGRVLGRAVHERRSRDRGSGGATP